MVEDLHLEHIVFNFRVHLIKATVRKVLVHRGLWLGIEIATYAEGEVLVKNEVLNFLQESRSLPQLDFRSGVIGVQMSVHHADPVGGASALGLLLLRTRKRLKDQHLRHIILAQSTNESPEV